MDFNKEIEKERKRYQEELAKLREEQSKNIRNMLDDREQNLLEKHYKKVKIIMVKYGKDNRN